MYLPALTVQLPHKDSASPLGDAFVAAVLKTQLSQRGEGVDDKIGHD